MSHETDSSINTLELLRDRRVINNLVLTACTFFALDVMSSYLPLYCKGINLNLAVFHCQLAGRSNCHIKRLFSNNRA